jgi:hypothetical protein
MPGGIIAAAFLAGFVPADEPVTPAAATIELRWCDPHRLMETGVDAVARELARIFRQADTAVSLTRAGEASAIRVVLVRSEPEAWNLPPNTMGAVLSRTGPQTEVYVFFRSIARVLGYRPDALSRRWLTPREERALGRALARVIAHELIHALLPARPHGEVGLTRVTLDRTALTAGDVRIEPALAVELSAVAAGRASRSNRQSP